MRKVCFIVENILRYMNDERSARGLCVNNRFQTGFIFFFSSEKITNTVRGLVPQRGKTATTKRRGQSGRWKRDGSGRGEAENSYFRVFP